MSINFQLRDLRAFLAVFDLGSFHKAAKALKLSQPTLSRRIQALEQQFGAALLIRSTRAIEPTAVGRHIEPIARRLVEEIDLSHSWMNEIDEQRAGTVSIAAIPTFAARLAPVVSQLKARLPLLRIRVLERSTSETLDCVAHGEAELGIGVANPSAVDTSFTPLMEDPYVLACRSGHQLARKESLTWADLAGWPLIRIGHGDDSNRTVLENTLMRENVRLDWDYEVNNITTALRWVDHGIGVCVVQESAISLKYYDSIVGIPIQSPTVIKTIGILERSGGRISPAAKVVRKMIHEELGDRKIRLPFSAEHAPSI